MPKISNVYLYYDEKRNTWYYSASLGYDVNGKRIQVVKRGFKTQREAKKAYDTFVANNSKESLQSNSTMLYEEFYKVYYLPEYERTVNERTYSNRIVSMNKHFTFFYKYKLKDINAPLIQQWKNKLSKNYTNGSLDQFLVVFKRV